MHEPDSSLGQQTDTKTPDVPKSCISCDSAERYELKGRSIVALCTKDDCPSFGRPIPYKTIVTLEPSAKLSDAVLGFAREKMAERKTRDKERRMGSIMKHDEEKETGDLAKITEFAQPPSEDIRGLPDELRGQFNRLDEDIRQINGSFENKFESIRKRLVKAKELKTKEEMEPKSEEQAVAKGWDQLIEKYRELLKSSESELNGLHQKACGVIDNLGARIKQVDGELPVKECELKVEQDLKEDAGNIEKLEKEVNILKKQLEECLPREQRVKELLNRIQYCAGETQ